MPPYIDPMWAEKHQKLLNYRQMRETPLGYVPATQNHFERSNNQSNRVGNAATQRLTQKLPITFLSDDDLRHVSTQFAHYVYSNRKKMSKSTRQRYRRYLTIGRDVEDRKRHMRQQQKAKDLFCVDRSTSNTTTTRAGLRRQQQRPLQRAVNNVNFEVASHWTDNDSISIASRKTSVASRSTVGSHSAATSRGSRGNLSAASRRTRPRTSDGMKHASGNSRVSNSRATTPSSTKRKRRAVSSRRHRPATGSNSTHHNQSSSSLSTSKTRPLSAHNRIIRNSLVSDSLIDNLETSLDASLDDVYRELPAYARRKIYDDQVREEHMKRFASETLMRKSATMRQNSSLLYATHEMSELSLRDGLEQSLRKSTTLGKASAASSTSQLVISSVKMHDPNSKEDDDELYYGTKELSEKIRNGKWKKHVPPPLPTYDVQQLEGKTLGDGDEDNADTNHAKQQHRHNKDSSAYKQQFHDYFKNDPSLNAPVDVTTFGAESFVDLRLLETEMSFSDLKDMLIDLYCEMRVPFSIGDELIDLYFDNDLPLSRKMILMEINKLILIRAELLRILEEIQKYKNQELKLNQSRGRVKASELQRRETQLQESAKIIANMIRKWQEQSLEIYPWRTFLYKGEDLLLVLGKHG